MKDEIKEILVDNDELIVRYKDNSFESFDTLLKNVLDYITNLQEENERLKNNIKSAFEVINTQMKSLSKGEAENLRIIKFNLIKGSCTLGDLTTEEDYKY